MGHDQVSGKGAASRAADTAEDAVEDAQESKTVRTLARSGFVATGLIHLLIGAIALGVALGKPGQADQSGAVGQLAKTPAGSVLVWCCLVACAVLALYMASEALVGGRHLGKSERLKKRLKAAGQALVFAAAASTFGSFALGHPTNTSEKSRAFSAQLMSNPAGTVLLAAIGAALIIAGGAYVFLGVTLRYQKALRGKPSGLPGDAFTVLGVFGYCAKGVALAAVGLLVIVATFQHDPSQQGGLDAALKAFMDQPFGVWVLAGVGLGLIAYGVFSLFRARYQRL
ncbi:DUF1206 domain-containing protein [Arthrobacter sp. M4]|uniref:DUF1206 domain-containing protein n=1 Tax=Arthrobacter sp. M4 TaxID=218160 RepID=UPI001CDCE14B|nr:DUF1206 domain-containing protein [Arthrobacter sp. M4]MCA4134307.1 DUF1206 domain-containing protein [Arthrobacter sp. M4]